MEICKYGEEVLKHQARKIEDIDDRVVQLVERMRFTMVQANGIGLAAPQIGESISLAIVDTTQGENQDEFMVLINPEIIDSEGTESGEEGCLSIPGISVPVARHTYIKIRAYDLQGREVLKEYRDHRARVIQHEIDHLQGVLIIDHLSSLKRKLIKKEIKKLKSNGQW